MSRETPEFSIAVRQGSELTSATQLFFECSKAPIIGVTGTKGKGTTATLIAEILKKAGYNVHLGGNVGTPLLSRVLTIKPSDWVVVELSSFQLEDLQTSPHIAVVLRITQDHLANYDKNATNFHKTRDEYIKAKSQIIRHQKSDDVAVLNADDQVSSGFSKLTPAKIAFFSRYGKKAMSYVNNHAVYIDINGKVEKICSRDTVKLRGDHNLENIAAASLAAHETGASVTAIRDAVSEFSGLDHRLKFVRSIGKVAYYDDSFSTIPETTIAALESFDEPKVLILGGSEKMSDFTDMGRKIAQSNTVGVVVIGQMTERIVKALRDGHFSGKIMTGCTTMTDIVVQAQKLATPGSVVILTPACASFDMFNNYKERGKIFQHEVLSLT